MRFLKHLSKGKEGWRYPDAWRKIVEKASDERCKDCKHVTSGFKQIKSPFQLMEVELYNVTKEHRAKSRNVSNSVKTQANKLLKELQPDKAKSFCASEYWMHRFCKRKKIKFRKRKSGKKKAEKIT